MGPASWKIPPGGVLVSNATPLDILTRPDVPECSVKPVENGYMVAVGSFRGDGMYDTRPVYVARTFEELCELLKFVAVKEKMAG